MSVQNIVLYSSYLFGAPTYSTNLDPESFELDLSEIANLQDTGFQLLEDAISIIEDAIAKGAVKPLADSVSMTEDQFMSAVKALTDAIVAADGVEFDQIKGLSDFILIKDWLSIRITKANIWQTTPAFGFRPSNIHLYGPGVFYGVDYYAANPTVNWLLSVRNSSNWKNFNGESHN